MDLFSRPQPAPKVDLKLIRIASPCPADWNRMAGDDLVRHCAECDLNVYNLSAMTERDIQRLLGNAQGRVCGRFYRRADGTILTQDCPRGLRAATRRVSRFVAAALAAVMSVASALAGPPQAKQGTAQTEKQPSNVTVAVTDPQGAVVPGAKVTMISKDGKRIYSAKTDSKGEARLNALWPGEYATRVSADGFQVSGKPVIVPINHVVQVTLPIGEVVGIIEIFTDESTSVNTQNGSLGQTLTQKQISDLPHK